MAILSTYRLQMRGAASGEAFTFADAEKLVDYLAELGVSHLYLSPILTAAEGSTHGYDVTDPTTISAELGGPEGFSQLVSTARAAGLGVVVDSERNVGMPAIMQALRTASAGITQDLIAQGTRAGE